MDIHAQFATDETAELEGRVFPMGKTAKVKVARTGNPRYVALLRKRLEESGIDVNSASKEDEAAAELIFADVQAETILLGWEGLTFKGEPLPFSLANAKKLLAIKEFRKKISSLADNYESFRVKAEEGLGNA